MITYCKKSFIFGGIILIYALYMVLLSGKEEGYYWMMFNKAYCCKIYFPLFFFGLFSLVSDLLSVECVIRYKKRADMVWRCFQILFYNAVYYAVIFLSINFIVEAFWGIYTQSFTGQRAIFFSVGFFSQVIGFLMLGSMFVFLYILTKHHVVAWGVSVVLMDSLTRIGEGFGEQDILRYFVSPYHSMYQFFLTPSYMDIAKVWLLEGSITLCFMIGIGFILKHRDFLASKKG